MQRLKRAIGTAGVVGVLALVGAACGDDSGGDGNLASWCGLGDQINRGLEAGEQISDETFDDFADAAPDDIRDASETAASAFKASPDDAFEDPEVQSAVEDIEAYSEGNCS